MSEDEFKSRLKIAKNKAEVHKDQKNPKSSSNMGTAFKMNVSRFDFLDSRRKQ